MPNQADILCLLGDSISNFISRCDQAIYHNESENFYDSLDINFANNSQVQTSRSENL